MPTEGNDDQRSVFAKCLARAVENGMPASVFRETEENKLSEWNDGHRATCAKLLAVIAARCPGGKLPDNYLVFDTETSGVDHALDRILQFGFLVVDGGVPEEEYSFYVRRSRDDVVISPGAFAVHGISYELLADKGVGPGEALRSVVDLFTFARAQDRMIVGHNAASFDASMFERECALVGNPFRFDIDLFLDTGMIVKAAQLNIDYIPDRVSLKAWYRRIADIRAPGVRWNLDRFCIGNFGLVKQGSVKAHDAGGDCVLTHRLFEELKKCIRT